MSLLRRNPKLTFMILLNNQKLLNLQNDLISILKTILAQDDMTILNSMKQQAKLFQGQRRFNIKMHLEEQLFSTH